jgi:hypothetical protein
MRKIRLLAQDVWYEIRTAVNNTEPLFWVARERARFEQVLSEAREIYVFELRGLRFCGPWISFYIKPADGFELPVIMQWIKQTYAVRFNVLDGRTGHIWGDRYESKILPGEPPEDAEGYVFLPVVCAAGRGRRRHGAADKGGNAAAPPGSPARDTEGRPRTGGRRHKTSGGTRRTAVTAGRGLPYGQDWRGGVCPICGHPPQVRAIPGKSIRAHSRNSRTKPPSPNQATTPRKPAQSSAKAAVGNADSHKSPPDSQNGTNIISVIRVICGPFTPPPTQAAFPRKPSQPPTKAFAPIRVIRGQKPHPPTKRPSPANPRNPRLKRRSAYRSLTKARRFDRTGQA